MLKKLVAFALGLGLSAVTFAAPALASTHEANFSDRDASVSVRVESPASPSTTPANASNPINAGQPHTLRRGTTPENGSAPQPAPNPAPTTPDNRTPSSLAWAFLPECWDAGVELPQCQPRDPGDPSNPANPAQPPAPPSREQVEAVVRTLVARLRLPDAHPVVAPDPTVNEWNMAVVGHPLWLWIDGADRLDTSVSGYGITITMNARRTGVSFAMGDGAVVRCTTMSRYSDSVEAGAPSPTCGHTYAKPSLPNGTYTVAATAHWAIDWTAIGYSGMLPLDITDARQLPVGELQAVVIRR